MIPASEFFEQLMGRWHRATALQRFLVPLQPLTLEIQSPDPNPRIIVAEDGRDSISALIAMQELEHEVRRSRYTEIPEVLRPKLLHDCVRSHALRSAGVVPECLDLRQGRVSQEIAWDRLGNVRRFRRGGILELEDADLEGAVRAMFGVRAVQFATVCDCVG